MLGSLRPALVLFALLTILCGFVYPGMVTGLAQVAFPAQAHGSLIEKDGKVLGSKLIGQQFSDPAYFAGRPSATGSSPYDARASSGSNLGPTNPALEERISKSVEVLTSSNAKSGAAPAPVPADLVTASASGLDPEISPAAARWQIPRVAKARGIDESRLRSLIEAHLQGRTFGVLGEARVSVLELNLALDALAPISR